MSCHPFLSFLAVLFAAKSIPLALGGIPDNTQPVGTNAITKFTVQYLGYQTANNSCSHRDLGFTGSIAGKWYAVYGDTLWCAQGVTNPADDPPGFHGLVRDSASALTSSPLVVQDLHLNSDSPVPHQLQLVPFNPDWNETNTYGFGGTSICETNAATSTGMLFYLVNANEDGLVGAGVARIRIINGTPTVVERYGKNGYWWPAASQGHIGDHAAYRDVKSDFIYAWGGPPNNLTGFVESNYVYQTRVKAEHAFDLSQYQYWWGRAKGWSSQVLTTFNSETAVMWGVGQGQTVYNDFLGAYVYVHLDRSNVMLRTAALPEGPWTADVQVYTATPMTSTPCYAGIAFPHLDPTGQTLTIGWTNDNHIEVLKVTFSK